MRTVSLRIDEKTYAKIKEIAEKNEQKPTEMLRKMAENLVYLLEN